MNKRYFFKNKGLLYRLTTQLEVERIEAAVYQGKLNGISTRSKAGIKELLMIAIQKHRPLPR